MESELFGYAEGTFTGQLRGGKKGLFGEAHGGTLFLDELGDMSMELQSKILRVLETKMYTPVGSHKQYETDVRIISATNRDLEKKIADGEFRQDLYYRLNVVKLNIPPLRERPEGSEYGGDDVCGESGRYPEGSGTDFQERAEEKRICCCVGTPGCLYGKHRAGISAERVSPMRIYTPYGRNSSD